MDFVSTDNGADFHQGISLLLLGMPAVHRLDTEDILVFGI